jgi:hypothetical protein
MSSLSHHVVNMSALDVDLAAKFSAAAANLAARDQ